MQCPTFFLPATILFGMRFTIPASHLVLPAFCFAYCILSTLDAVIDMLRPIPSRLCITTSDIHDLKLRLAKRRAQTQSVRNTDCLAVHTASQQPSQNARPLKCHKGVLRPGPARSRHLVADRSDASRSDPSPSVAALSNASSSQSEQDWLSDIIAPNQEARLSSTATNLAEARRALDRLADGTAPSSALAESPQPSPGHAHFAFSGFLSSHDRQRYTEHSPAFDGTNDFPFRHRGGDSHSPYHHSTPRISHLPDEYSLPHLPRLETAAPFSIATPLDPLAPSFIPAVRFGSAHEERRASTSSNDQDSHHLRVRPISSINSGNRRFVPATHRPVTRSRSRLSLRGRRHNQGGLRVGGLGTHSRSHHQTDSSIAQPATTAERHPLPSYVAPILPIQPTASLTSSSIIEVQELSNPITSTQTTYMRPGIVGDDAGSQRSTSARPRPHIPTRPISSSTIHSVPDLVSRTSEAPVIHTRHSSLGWNRAASGGTKSEGSVPSVAIARSRTHTSSSVPVYYPSGYNDPPQSFYLNHSPLDELTAGLRRFSAASSARQSSGGSNPMRPFRGNLLSGSLFYSEDLYSEDQQSSSESEPLSNGSHPSGAGSDIPPLFADHRGQTYHAPVHMRAVMPSSSPQTSSTSPPALDNAPPAGSSYYSGSSPILNTAPSPSHMSSATSGPSYSLPVISVVSGPLFASSPPPPVRSVPNDNPILASSSVPLSTPSRPRAQRPSAAHEDRLTRPTPTSKFRIYEDDLPAGIQPKTPADVGRRYPARSSVPSKSSTSTSGSTPSPMRNCSRRTYPPRPIFEPTTAELTTIPFLSPLHSTRQTRERRRRRGGNRSTLEDQENGFDASAIIGLEDDRMAWMRRRVEAEGNAAGMGILNVLEETPPREGRFERMMRS